MELGEIRELLAAAQGYVVLGRDRKRVGIFIELPDGDGEWIAIRRDGILVWRRVLLPLATVASVLPERRAVLLNVARGALDEEPVMPLEPPQEDLAWRERIESYVSSANGEADAHLRFISSPSGYELVEAQGRPPSAGSTIVVPEQVGSFRVMKLGPSPLPHDNRVCAYLAPN
jgi:hypothetical protein